MRVALDANAIGTGRGGDETFLRALLAGLAELTDDEGPDLFPVLLRPGEPPPDSIVGRRAFPIRRIGGPGPIRHTISVPRAILGSRRRVDLLHSIIHGPPVSTALLALSVPDISFVRHPEYFPPRARLRLNTLVPRQARRARIVTTVSEFSRQDIIAAWSLPAERVFVIPNAVDVPTPRAPTEDSAGPGWETPFFLYVGNLHPRKNVPRLIEAFARARRAAPALERHQLLIAGAAWWGGSDEERAARALPTGVVRLLGPVSSTERDTLMRQATALVYPSLFEGFGLPPLEAMAQGTPVVASNVSAIPEVLGDAAILVDPLSVDDIASALVRVATTPGLRDQLVGRGIERARRYTTRATGEAALLAFRYAVGASPV